MIVDWVAYGRPAAEALRVAIGEAKGDEPLAPVTVVVPANHVGVSTRRLLASGVLGPVCSRGVGLVGVSFLTVYRVAELLGAPGLAASGRRPVSTPVIAAAVRAALVADPGVFAPVASHPATEAALVATYRELRDLSSSALDTLATRSRRANDVVRLHRFARAWLVPNWYDEEDLMASAVTELHGAAALGTVIVYLPQRLGRHAAELLRSVGTRVLAGITDDQGADAEVLDGVARLDAGRLHLTPSVSPRPPARVVTTSDADEEVRVAVRAVVDAARAGTPLDRIVLLHPGIEPYPRLLHEHLRAAGIAANGPSVTSLAASVAGRALVALLDLPAGGFRREEVFAWLACAPMVREAAAWERVSRDAGVIAGRRDWSDRLEHFAREREQVAAADDPDAPGWRAQRARTQARDARNLRRFVLELVDDLASAAATPRTWGEHARWVRRHLARLGDGEGWPAPERDATARVLAAVDRLAALDEIDGPVDLDVFARTLRMEMDADLGRVGRFGDGVFVGPVSMGVGLDADLVAIVGLAEGSYPARIHEDSLLPDHERVAAGDLALAGDRVGRQHRWLLAALAGGDRHLICVPRGDLRRSTERVPSRWVDVAGCEHVASFDAGLRALASPATAQEHRLRTLMGGPLRDPIVTRGTEMVEARRSDRFTRFDGNLAGLPIPPTLETSATRLERWAVCPFASLMGDVLGVAPIDNPEDHLQVAPMVKGELIHTILERFLLEHLAVPPPPDQAWSDTDRQRLAAIADEVCADYEASGLTGRAIFWARDRERIHGELRRFLADDSAHRRAHRSHPVAAELAFSAVRLELPGGRAVHFRGKADRVDEAEDGTLHVMDYKSGKPDRYNGLSATDPDLGGRKLQLPVYALAARQHRAAGQVPVEAEYWFVSEVGGFRRIGYPVTPEVLDLVAVRVEAIVEGIEAGVFPHRPTTQSTTPFVECQWCDPDGLGVADLRRQWERKRHDPALAAYVAMSDSGSPAHVGATGG
ncbi:MAG: PD-(D/E)XK nuclease family protein [Acidimicrobiales bacterium]